MLFKSDVDVYIIAKKNKKCFQQLCKFQDTSSIQCKIMLIENSQIFFKLVLITQIICGSDEECCGNGCFYHAIFLDALASLKTMLDIHSVADVFKISRLQSIREYCRV